MTKKKTTRTKPSPSRSEYLAEAARIASQIATSYSFGYHTPNDVRQECLVLALEAYESGAYDPALGDPGPFLRRHFTFKLRTKFRAEVCRGAPPCRKCSSGKPCGGGGEATPAVECSVHKEWVATNYQKGTLARPAFPCDTPVDRAIPGGIDEVEFIDLVDSLPADLRAAALLLMGDDRAALEPAVVARLREALAPSYGVG